MQDKEGLTMRRNEGQHPRQRAQRVRRQGAQWERSIPQVSAEQAQERTVGEGPVGRTAAEVR